MLRVFMETENNMQEIGNKSREMETLIIESKENAKNQKHKYSMDKSIKHIFYSKN